MWPKSLFLKINRSEQSWILKNKYLISIFFVTVNLATYRQFTIGCLRLNYSKKQKQKQKQIKIALSLGYSNSYLYNKSCNMLLKSLYLSFFWLYNVADFWQCQSHSSRLHQHSVEKTPSELMDRFTNFTQL